jgi:LuxR family maltose regulon positive regulatory protein
MELVHRAIAFVLPDGLFNQLVFYNQLTNGVVEDCIAHEYPAYKEQFDEVKRRILSPFASAFPEITLDELPERLTEREREIASLAACGLRNEEIAQKLFLSVSTVRTHLRSVFRKMDIDRRAKLAEKLR